jgi:hypothetical protein
MAEAVPAVKVKDKPARTSEEGKMALDIGSKGISDKTIRRANDGRL